MQSVNEAIAHSLTVSQALLNRYTNDLKSEEYLHRPTDKANCAAWLIGHVTLSDRRTLEALGGDPPPLPDGFAQRFSRDEGCPQAGDFGDVTGLMGIFNENRNRLIETVRRATAQQLNTPLERGIPPMAKTAGELANFMAAHVAMHAGQITIIRRSLGKPPLV
jgi:hypothetical protein